MVPRVGHRVPDFTLPDSDKREVTLSELTRNGNTIIAFFPFAFSGMCDREMCTFRDDAARLDSLHARVIGISVDSVFTLKIFGQTYGIEFALLSDFNKKVTSVYGILEGVWGTFGYKGVSKQAIFVVDDRRVLRYRWIADGPASEPPYDQMVSVLTKLQ